MLGLVVTVDDPWDQPPVYDDDMSEPGIPGWFVALFVLVLVAGVLTTIWKVSTARRMARDAGISEDDAAAVTLMADNGFEATYLASNLRSRPDAPPPVPGTARAAERLRELRSLLDQGLISQAEHDARRQAIIDSV